MSGRVLQQMVVAIGMFAGCTSGSAPSDTSPDASVIRCSLADDPDGDFVSSMDEGTEDFDGDGTPNSEDTDADGDSIPDRDEAGDLECTTPPVDTDGDGMPDLLDRDANGDGVDDAEQRDADTDGDSTPDWLDTDVDGDGIRNDIEHGDGAEPVDTDGDGTPDVFDDDSDGDTILDANEGSADGDGDGSPNFRDLDSDGDSLDDAYEAGDADPATPPHTCREERDADGYADFEDADQDNDGLGDAEERALGTDLCGPDTDGDGLDDLAEAAFERINCPDGRTGEACGCATDESCQIPPQHFYVVLPYEGEPVHRTLDFGTTVRVADVFFLTDTTGSMAGTLANVKRTIALDGGLIDQIGSTIDDVWFGGGRHDDYPFLPYGGDQDEVFELVVRMTPPTLPGMPEGSGSQQILDAFRPLRADAGGTWGEASIQALEQVMIGEGGRWRSTEEGFSYRIPRYVGECLDGMWGAPCFRTGSLPIILHFTDACAHGTPDAQRGTDTETCLPQERIRPRPTTFDEVVTALRFRGARYVGVNANNFIDCWDGSDHSRRIGPCHLMRRLAEETNSVDVDGRTLVYDLPNDSAASTFVDTVTDAIDTIAARVPFDVDTGLRNDDGNADDVDATRFITARVPGCNATPAITPCFAPPAGVAPEDAVASIDDTTFHRVVPGTRVTFAITFHNDFHPGGLTAQVFVAYIDVRADGGAVLDTHQVFIVVPANSTLLPI